jgi:chemotaxis protein MotB
MSDCEEECPECPAGIPAWVMTFADLMSLLMCFFVLLLSFSEMDALKYKQLAGSMSEAFGVQNDIKVKDIPKGTSIIAQEFSPGRPQPTPLNEVRQSTTDITQSNLDVNCPDGSADAEDTKGEDAEEDSESAAKKLQELVISTQADAMQVAGALQEEIASGQVEGTLTKTKTLPPSSIATNTMPKAPSIPTRLAKSTYILPCSCASS